MDVEILTSDDNSLRGKRMLRAMLAAAPAAGINATASARWTRSTPVLMSYGLGHPGRRPWIETHLSRGGRVIGWDLSYWDRDAAMRLTIDDHHPHRWIEPADGARWNAAGIGLRDDYDSRGPVILCGLGAKQRRLRGLSGREWEASTLGRLRAEHGKRQILYHPKRVETPLPGAQTAMGRIEDVMKHASLVVTSHSNVAVDACIAGVPVACDDGAALALYSRGRAPTRDQRLEFLRSLAWWQWRPDEAVEAWGFIRKQLERTL